MSILVLGAVLAACGAGGDAGSGGTDTPGRWATVSLPPPVEPAPDAGGRWSDPFDLSIIAIHLALQPGGTVLYYGSTPEGTQSAAAHYAFWDPSLGTGPQSLTLLENTTGTDLFCSAQILLGDGRTLVAGGDQVGPDNLANPDSTLIDERGRTIVSGPKMQRARWYASATTLMSGEVYLQGGNDNDRPEIRGEDGRYRLLAGADTSNLSSNYPRNYIAPDGRIFGIDDQARLYYVDPAGEGSVRVVDHLPMTAAGIYVPTAQFRPGRFLRLSAYARAATVIDIRGMAPAWHPTQSAPSIRTDGIATVLPDGRVLLTGGSAEHNLLESADNAVSIWDPVSGEWSRGPAQQYARLYHGSALLLHDGRVLSAGGGAPGPLTNRNGELYSPQYLLDAQGGPAPRPVITDAPTVLDPARSFGLKVAEGPVSRVTLVRFGTVTHSWSGDQTFVDLPFRPLDATGASVRVQLPGQATQTPPGFYLLFAFNDQGVPSVARTLRILPPPASGWASPTAPVVHPIEDQTWTARSLTVRTAGRSPQGRRLTWSASGLPPGLVVDPTWGSLRGQPTRRGTYFVTIAADDGEEVGSASFLLQIGASDVTLQPPVAAPQATAGAPTRLQAQAEGRGLTYTWDFGDGTPVLSMAGAAAIDHVFPRPGLFPVTVTVHDPQGRSVTGRFMQFVQPARLTGPTAASSMLAWTGSGDAARLWVVNPDSDTLTGFHAQTGARVAEVAVGRQPVTVTAGGDGRLWVASRRAGELALVDPLSARVVRTLTLPEGALPYGVVGDPAGRSVWVALEGTGRLLRFDAATATQTAEVVVGPDVRHLAITADSATVLASRFITPPLPGESTAQVQPAGRGGEVLRVDATTARLIGTVLLVHSDRPDAENQGRGVPNYLGAVALSPDGEQAFVPSKQDNLMRGRRRDGQDLDFQNTVRAIVSRIDLTRLRESPEARIDLDNASVASAAAFDPAGTLLFVALETSREVAVIDAASRTPLLRVDTGRAPQGLLVAPDGSRLFVANFMDRSIDVFDLMPLRRQGRLDLPRLATLATTAAEKLSPQVLAGKQLFYDARDPRLARDRYLSCATCHADGGHDGRTWDMTGLGEGLRNTPSLRGRGGMGAGPLHWTGTFDEVQDFEGQIRRLAGGLGLMRDADFAVGTRAQPLGLPKAGVSADLDALAAYVGSLRDPDPVPRRAEEALLAQRGEAVFASRCLTCHAGPLSTDSAPGLLRDVGTLTPASGQRLGAALTGLDTPALIDAWQTAPYLHDGSAATLEQAVTRHVAGLSDEAVRSVAAFVRAGARSPRTP